MTYYAVDDRLTTDSVEGAVEITKQEYLDAIAAKAEGRNAKVIDGGLVIFSGETKTVYSTETGEAMEIAAEDETPDGYTETARPDHTYDWDGEAWVLNTEKATKRDILSLEAQITPRRIREAMLTNEGKAWLEDIESQIEVLRGQI